MNTHKYFTSSSIALAAGLTALSLCHSAVAGTISGWSLENVDSASGPYTAGQLYTNPVYVDAAKLVQRGSVGWVHGDRIQPGMKIVNGDDVNGSNCVMAAGTNPIDSTTKQCSDPAGTNKSVDVRILVLGGSGIDLVFNLDESAGTTTYHFYQTLTNVSPERIDKFKFRLGFGVGGGFSTSANSDGLAFADAAGTPYAGTWINADPLQPANLAGNMPTHLYGAGTGFFDATALAGMGTAKAKENEIQFASLTATYRDVWGRWLSLAEVPYGYFYDGDNNPNTQATLVAYWNGTATAPQWLDASLTPVSQTQLDSWAVSNLHSVKRIEGLASFQYRFNVNVGTIANWSTFNATTRKGSFTLRIIPSSGAGTATTWLDSAPITEPPAAPVANNDTYSLPDATVAFNVSAANGVLSNDSVAPGANMIATLVSQPSAGTLVFNTDGSFEYSAGTAYTGSDSFTYIVNDGVQDSNTATVTISGGAASAPIAANDSYTITDSSVPYVVSIAAEGVLGNDSFGSSGNTLTAIRLSVPSNGTVTLNANGTFTYVAGVGYNGSDSFTYKANDGVLDSNVATVTITGGTTSTGTPGGCALANSLRGNLRTAGIDPMLPLLAIGSIGLIFRRRRK